MMDLVLLPNTPEDRDSVGNGGLVYKHLSESPFEGRVFFDILGILSECSSADASQLATGEQGLEEIGSVHTASLRASSGHDQVHLIDEQDHAKTVFSRLFDLCNTKSALVNWAKIAWIPTIQDGLDALLVFTLVLCTCHECTHIQAEEPADEGCRNISAGDPLREPLSNSRLSYTRFTDQYRVVFCPPAQNPDDAPNLVVATDDGIELALLGQSGQVDRIFGKCIESCFCTLALNASVATNLLDRAREELFR